MDFLKNVFVEVFENVFRRDVLTLADVSLERIQLMRNHFRFYKKQSFPVPAPAEIERVPINLYHRHPDNRYKRDDNRYHRVGEGRQAGE